MMKRIEANDPVAMCHLGVQKCEGTDYSSAFDYFTKAAELGDVEAHFKLACLYDEGLGVEKNRGKHIHHAEEAAIGGHPEARYKLALHEMKSDNTDRAMKHLIIAAAQGEDVAIKLLMEAFKRGHVNKDDLAASLRAHQAAVDATKSPQRDAAEEY